MYPTSSDHAGTGSSHKEKGKYSTIRYSKR